MALKLTPRLQAVANHVPLGARLADVGTDHAYLPAWLLLEERIPFAVCTDLRKGPLDRARETVEHYGVANRVSLRLGDGLAGVDSEEVDCVAIAGMGGETILHILGQAPWTAEKSCVVQPMSSLGDLRAGLGGLGLRVARETIVREGKTLYIVMDLVRGREGPLTAAEQLVGRAANHTGDALWPEYLAQEIRRARRALTGLAQSGKAENQARSEELKAALAGLEQMEKEL